MFLILVYVSILIFKWELESKLQLASNLSKAKLKETENFFGLFKLCSVIKLQTLCHFLEGSPDSITG